MNQQEYKQYMEYKYQYDLRVLNRKQAEVTILKYLQNCIIFEHKLKLLESQAFQTYRDAVLKENDAYTALKTFEFSINNKYGYFIK